MKFILTAVLFLSLIIGLFGFQYFLILSPSLLITWAAFYFLLKKRWLFKYEKRTKKKPTTVATHYTALFFVIWAILVLYILYITNVWGYILGPCIGDECYVGGGELVSEKDFALLGFYFFFLPVSVVVFTAIFRRTLYVYKEWLGHGVDLKG